jgi:hypothetical protein
MPVVEMKMRPGWITILFERDWLLRFLDQFVKSLIAAQRIPIGVELQLTIANQSTGFDGGRKLCDCAIILSRPCVDDGEEFDNVRTVELNPS